MEKIVINNQIVQMRKFVKQAKTHTINKCTKQIKALQNKKGSENQMLKYQRKKERLLKEIAILKSMKPDFVSKLALSKAKDWESVLKQKNISLEERCLSLLANYTAVKKEVDKFYFNQSHLISKIPNLLLEWEARNQNPNDTSKNKIGKQKTKDLEFRNASFPNNIKISKRTDAPITSKPMLPHLASNKSEKEESSEQIVEHTFNSDSMESNIQEKIKLKEFLSKSNNLSAKKENSKRMLKSDNKFLKKKSLDSLSSDSINDSGNACHMKNSIDKTALCKKKKENLATNKNIFPLDVSDIRMEESDESNSSNHSDSGDGKNKDGVTHDGSDIEMEESEENVSDHHSEIDHSEISPTVVVDKKVPERAKLLLKDKQVHKKLDLKKYLQPLKSASENNVSINNKPTIVSKLKAISHSDFKKSVTKITNQKNTKAIAELDLNEIQDLDEIPLESSLDLEEPNNKVIINKSDSFFLTADDSHNGDLEITDENTKIKMPFKSGRSNINKRVLNSNFSSKRFADGSSEKEKKIFKGNTNFHWQKNSEHFFKQDKDSNFTNKKKFNLKEKRNFLEKHQSGNKRNFDFERKRPSEFPKSNQKISAPKSFHQNKDGYAKKEVEDKKSIHPSWEAKQKMKESLKLGFQGKRVVFS